MMRALFSIGLLLLATGCVEKIAEHRVRTALVEAGLSDRNADCMAQRMVDRLTIKQLRKLEALKSQKRSAMDYVEAVRRVSDPELLSVTASSAALCATGLVR
jgi:hypothetical protein